MSNRFDDKFKKLPKTTIEEEKEEEGSILLTSGITEDEIETPVISIESNPLDSLQIEKTPKKANKTYYIDLNIAKELEQVAKNNKISSSKLLEHILKEVLKTE